MSNRTETYAKAESAIRVGGRIILPEWQTYTSNSPRQNYGFLATFGDDCDLKELFAATASLYFKLTPAT
jgi:hypothetical protein